MGITMNGPSGIDTASLIQQLTDLEMQKVYKIESQKKTVNKRIDAYSQFETFLSDISKSATKMDDREDFNMYTSTSSSDSTATVSTSFGAQPGSYDLKVFQLAEREKLISKDGVITSNQSNLSAMGINPGKFKINGTEISLEADDTLEELRVKINTAKKEDGSKIGVTATILKMADNNYRFVLTSDDTGSKGGIYEDTEGSVLQSMGIITGYSGTTKETFESKNDIKAAFEKLTDGKTIVVKGVDSAGATVESTYTKTGTDTVDDFKNFVATSFGGEVTTSIDALTGKLKMEANTGGTSSIRLNSFTFDGVAQGVTRTGFGGNQGSKGITKETYGSALNAEGKTMGEQFAALAEGGKISIAGTDASGKAVSATYVRGASDNVDSFSKFVESSFNGMVTASFGADGSLSVEDKNGGNSLFSVSAMSVENSSFSFGRTVTGYKGDNVLSAGREAYYSVDNIKISSSTNKPTGVAKGINFELKSVGYDKATTVSVTRDISGLAKKLDDLVNSYNAVARYVSTSTKFIASDDESGAASGVLVGDMTAKTVQYKVRGVFMEAFNITGNKSFTALAQLGVKTNTQSGQYELDRTKFESALNENFEEVVSLFVNEGYTDNSSVMFGTKSKDTAEGVYDLVEDGSGGYKISLVGGNGTQYSGSRSGDVVSFSDGPAKGLYVTAPTGSGNAKVTYSKGLAGRLTDVVNSVTAAETGTFAVRKKSMQSQIKNYSTMAEAMQKRVTSFTERLTKQFASMEQTMSSLKSQQSAMLSQLGYSSN